MRGIEGNFKKTSLGNFGQMRRNLGKIRGNFGKMRGIEGKKGKF